MSLFKTILSKIFSDPAPAAPPAPPISPNPAADEAPGVGRASAVGATFGAVAGTAFGGSPSLSATGATSPRQPVSTPAERVDVGALMDRRAAAHPEKLDWKRSIVDLMKLLDMDSSLAARKELAAELDYTGDTADSAKMNVWLHRQVLKKISENGGNVPETLLA